MIKLKGKKKSGIEKGYYDVLDVSPSSPTTEIRGSFEKLVEELVDLNSQDLEVRRNSAEILYNLSKAYDVLIDPFQRINYDERKFGENQPYNTQVETIFKEGVRYFKLKDMDRAIRFLKESVDLMPHKVTYRINLAAAYHEKGMIEIAENELRTSLRLDPTNEFAQEMIAKLFFNVSDKKNVGFLSQKVNRQLALAVASIVLLTGILFFGTPRVVNLFKNIDSKNSAKLAEEKYKNIEAQLPSDMRKYLENKKNNSASQPPTSQPISIFNVVRLDDNFVPQGNAKDYTKQTAIKKTYYEDQGIVVVTCSDGSILTYKLGDLVGWKIDKTKNLPVVITKNNEIIPIPTNIPVTLADGRTITPEQSDFPKNAFPEYGEASAIIEPPKEEPQNVAPEQQNIQNTPVPSESIAQPETQINNINDNKKDDPIKNNNTPPAGIPSVGIPDAAIPAVGDSSKTLPVGDISDNKSDGK